MTIGKRKHPEPEPPEASAGEEATQPEVSAAARPVDDVCPKCGRRGRPPGHD